MARDAQCVFYATINQFCTVRFVPNAETKGETEWESVLPTMIR